MRLRIAAAVLLVLVGLGSVAFVLLGGTGTSNASPAAYLTAQAAVGDVTVQVAATGNVQAASTYALVFGQAPQLATSTSSSSSASSSSNNGSNSSGATAPTVKTVSVVAGQAVKAGDVLATEDTAAAELALTNAKASLASAQTKLSTDQAGPTSAVVQAAQLAITQAQQQLAQAQQNQADTNAQNALAVQQAQAALASAQERLAADQAASPPVAASVITADQNAVTSAQQALANAQAKATQAAHQSSASVSSAQLSVTTAQNSYAQKTAATAASQIQADQAAVASAQQQVDTAQRTLDYTTLTAPVAGTVIAVNAQVGFGAPTGTAIQMVADGLNVSASVTESDVTKLKLGQAASITLTALGQSIQGTVSAIGNASNSGSNSVVTYPVTVQLANPPATLRIGMTANVTIDIDQAAGVLAVPTAAVNGTAGSYTVTVMDTDGTTQAVPVQIGLVGDSLTQVTSGLQAGQRVVTGVNTTRTGSTAGGFGGFGGLGGGGTVIRQGAGGGNGTGR